MLNPDLSTANSNYLTKCIWVTFEHKRHFQLIQASRVGCVDCDEARNGNTQLCPFRTSHHRTAINPLGDTRLCGVILKRKVQNAIETFPLTTTNDYGDGDDDDADAAAPLLMVCRSRLAIGIIITANANHQVYASSKPVSQKDWFVDFQVKHTNQTVVRYHNIMVSNPNESPIIGELTHILVYSHLFICQTQTHLSKNFAIPASWGHSGDPQRTISTSSVQQHSEMICGFLGIPSWRLWVEFGMSISYSQPSARLNRYYIVLRGWVTTDRRKV